MRPAHVIRWMYTLAFTAALPAVLLRLWWRGFRTPPYRLRWHERLGALRLPPLASRPIWVHAVSVGEAQAAIPLVREIAERMPVLFTTTTPAASGLVRKQLGPNILHAYAPLDLPWIVQRFLRRARPRALLIMETELWPNLLHACHKRGIPVGLVNARLSERSLRRYRWAAPLIREALAPFAFVAAQTPLDAKRFTRLGALRHRVSTAGSTKFDVHLPEGIAFIARRLRADWGRSRRIWIAASTHPGEDEHVLEAFAQVRHYVPNALLVLVPRHPERAARVAALCKEHGFTVLRRSEQRACTAFTDVVLGDTIGELVTFYAAADVAFVGGTLTPIGGHNLIEPAQQQRPIIIGPHTHNCASIAQLLLARGAACRVETVDQLAQAVVELLTNEKLCSEMGDQAARAVAENTGALERVLALVDEHILGDEVRTQPPMQAAAKPAAGDS